MPATPLRAEQIYSAAEVADLLSISRSTFYTIVFFKNKKVRMSAQRVGYMASDVALYQSLNRGN